MRLMQLTVQWQCISNDNPENKPVVWLEGFNGPNYSWPSWSPVPVGRGSSLTCSPVFSPTTGARYPNAKMSLPQPTVSQTESSLTISRTQCRRFPTMESTPVRDTPSVPSPLNNKHAMPSLKGQDEILAELKQKMQLKKFKGHNSQGGMLLFWNL